MRIILISFFLIAHTFSLKAQLYSAATAKLSFYSKTPVEDIQAVSEKTKGLLNIKTGEVAFIVENTSFVFPNKLMQEHFNEKYMESEKFPISTFKGKVVETIDYEKDGEHKVSVLGKLNIHGVEIERTIPGVITIKEGVVQIKSDFKVKVADHKIQIPKLVLAKIAEEITVGLDAKLTPRK